MSLPSQYPKAKAASQMAMIKEAMISAQGLIRASDEDFLLLPIDLSSARFQPPKSVNPFTTSAMSPHADVSDD